MYIEVIQAIVVEYISIVRYRVVNIMITVFNVYELSSLKWTQISLEYLQFTLLLSLRLF